MESKLPRIYILTSTSQIEDVIVFSTSDKSDIMASCNFFFQSIDGFHARSTDRKSLLVNLTCKQWIYSDWLFYCSYLNHRKEEDINPLILIKKSVFLTFWEFPESLDSFREYYHKTRVGKKPHSQRKRRR